MPACVHLDNKLLHKYCELMTQPRLQLRVFSEVTQYFFSSLIRQILKLRRNDCYRSADLPRKDDGVTQGANIQSDCFSPVSWVGSVLPSTFDECLLGFFISSAVPIDHTVFCSLVFDEYLFAPDRWSWNVTMASLVVTSLIVFSLRGTSSQLLWLSLSFTSTCFSTVQEFTRNLQNAWKSWKGW